MTFKSGSMGHTVFRIDTCNFSSRWEEPHFSYYKILFLFAFGFFSLQNNPKKTVGGTDGCSPKDVQLWTVYHGEGMIFYTQFKAKKKNNNNNKKVKENTAFSSFANYGIPTLSIK